MLRLVLAVDVLQADGARVHLVNPSGLQWGDRRVKNDYPECRELIDRMRLHKLPEAWIAPHEVREPREVGRYGATRPECGARPPAYTDKARPSFSAAERPSRLAPLFRDALVTQFRRRL